MRTSALGSLPGTDLGAGVRLALEAVSVPWLPEVPARGPWAGMVGRALGLLDGLGAELSAGETRRVLIARALVEMFGADSRSILMYDRNAFEAAPEAVE